MSQRVTSVGVDVASLAGAALMRPFPGEQAVSPPTRPDIRRENVSPAPRVAEWASPSLLLAAPRRRRIAPQAPGERAAGATAGHSGHRTFPPGARVRRGPAQECGLRE